MIPLVPGPRLSSATAPRAPSNLPLLPPCPPGNGQSRSFSCESRRVTQRQPSPSGLAPTPRAKEASRTQTSPGRGRWGPTKHPTGGKPRGGGSGVIVCPVAPASCCA